MSGEVVVIKPGVMRLEQTLGVKELTQVINAHLPSIGGLPREVELPNRKMKVFNFRWSNAQRRWSVCKNFDTRIDGSEFVLYVPNTVLSPLGKKWTQIEMEYIAMGLCPHPWAW
jgi:hypothetical protein